MIDRGETEEPGGSMCCLHTPEEEERGRQHTDKERRLFLLFAAAVQVA